MDTTTMHHPIMPDEPGHRAQPTQQRPVNRQPDRGADIPKGDIKGRKPPRVTKFLSLSRIGGGLPW